MQLNSDLLTGLRHMAKLYEALLRQSCEAYRLTQIETDILAFLKNNPGRDTARDIVGFRLLQKGNVSQAVDSLMRKGYLARRQDERDRRLVHLQLTDQAGGALRSIEWARGQFLSEIFSGFSEKERTLYLSLNERLFDNAKAGLERKR